jgi:hypothetical protein
MLRPISEPPLGGRDAAARGCSTNACNNEMSRMKVKATTKFLITALPGGYPTLQQQSASQT